MRNVLVGLVVVSIGTLVVGAAAGSTLAGANPCKLVTAADVKAAVGSAAGRGKLQTLGLYRSCTYTTQSSAFVTVQTRTLAKADFATSARMNPGPVKAVSGLGAPAYYVGRATLLIWRHGNEATFSVFGAGPALSTEVKLAKRALARM
jgi:hypothetical protein